MGVEYSRYLIPRPNTFRPSPDSSLALVDALRDDGWLLDSDAPALKKLIFTQSRIYDKARANGYFARRVGDRDSFREPLPDLFENFSDRDLMVVWPVQSLAVSGLRYPLEPLPIDDPAQEDCYYEVQLHFAHDFIYHGSEVIEPFDPTPTCSCEHALEYRQNADHDPFYSARLAAKCPQCDSKFDPTDLVATGRDSETNAPYRIQGGATYRFAVIIDCGSCFSRQAQQRFHPELKSLVEQTLDIETYDVGDYY